MLCPLLPAVCLALRVNCRAKAALKQRFSSRSVAEMPGTLQGPGLIELPLAAKELLSLLPGQSVTVI